MVAWLRERTTLPACLEESPCFMVVTPPEVWTTTSVSPLPLS